MAVTDLAEPDARARVPSRPAGGRARAALRRAAPALLAYAGVRALGVAVLTVWSAAAGTSARHLLSARWDSIWYARVADDGYGYTIRLADGSVHSDLAFFPLLPWLERGIAAVGPLGTGDAGLVVSAVASLFAAWGIFATGELVYGRRAGVALVAVWAVLPVGIVQSMAYSESLFTALAAWGVYATLTGRWVWAGTFAALAGLTRPVGAAVVAAVWAGAAVALLPGGRWRGMRRTDWRMLLGAALAPLGWLAYFVWVASERGSVTGYLDVQGGWGNGFDGGAAFARFVGGRLAGPAFPAGVGLLVGVGLLIWLYVRGVRQGQPLPLLVYGGTVLLLALTAKGYFGSKPRLLIPAFPVLLPLALSLVRPAPARGAAEAGGAEGPPGRAGITRPVLIVAAVAVASAAYGAFWLNGSGPP